MQNSSVFISRIHWRNVWHSNVWHFCVDSSQESNYIYPSFVLVLSQSAWNYARKRHNVTRDILMSLTLCYAENWEQQNSLFFFKLTFWTFASAVNISFATNLWFASRITAGFWPGLMEKAIHKLDYRFLQITSPKARSRRARHTQWKIRNQGSARGCQRLILMEDLC